MQMSPSSKYKYVSREPSNLSVIYRFTQTDVLRKRHLNREIIRGCRATGDDVGVILQCANEM